MKKKLYGSYLKIEEKCKADVSWRLARQDAIRDCRYMLCAATELPPEEVATANEELWRTEAAVPYLKNGLEMHPVISRFLFKCWLQIEACILALVWSRR